MPKETFYSDLSLCHLRSNFGLRESLVGSNNHSRNWAKILLEHCFESMIHMDSHNPNICQPTASHHFGNKGFFLPLLLFVHDIQTENNLLLLFSSCCCFEFNQFSHFISSTLLSVGPTSINTEWNMQSGANIHTLSKNFLKIQTLSFASPFSIVTVDCVPCDIIVLRNWPGCHCSQTF